MTIAVRPLNPTDAVACDHVVLGHPDFFGHEGGRAECARAVRTQEGWVAEEDGRVLGFATWHGRTPASAEITWMAVLRERRHGGIGTAIVEALVDDLTARGFRLALAITAADGDTYEPTRRFWTARGFLPLIELPIWDTNVALLQVRALTEVSGVRWPRRSLTPVT